MSKIIEIRRVLIVVLRLFFFQILFLFKKNDHSDSNHEFPAKETHATLNTKLIRYKIIQDLLGPNYPPLSSWYFSWYQTFVKSLFSKSNAYATLGANILKIAWRKNEIEIDSCR